MTAAARTEKALCLQKQHVPPHSNAVGGHWLGVWRPVLPSGPAAACGWDDP